MKTKELEEIRDWSETVATERDELRKEVFNLKNENAELLEKVERKGEEGKKGEEVEKIREEEIRKGMEEKIEQVRKECEEKSESLLKEQGNLRNLQK